MVTSALMEIGQVVTMVGVIVAIIYTGKKQAGTGDEKVEMIKQILIMFQNQNEVASKVALRLVDIDNNTDKIHKANNRMEMVLGDIRDGEVKRSMDLKYLRDRVDNTGTGVNDGVKELNTTMREGTGKLHEHMRGNKKEILDKLDKLGGLLI